MQNFQAKLHFFNEKQKKCFFIGKISNLPTPPHKSFGKKNDKIRIKGLFFRCHYNKNNKVC
ncbi:MAG: hypothetical protein EAZ95_04735 [Bacteroidetes bacterium]|nr:MAG: hypothetical protein EAZ95_04735 [Bacteroidota bacterium]